MEHIPTFSQEAEDLGISIRRKLFGEDRVEAQRKSAEDPFMRDFYETLNHHCFADTWGRPGIPWKARSMITMAMLVALGKSVELKLHIGTALRNGLSKDEIKEVLLQATVYCGIPAGVEAFRTARDLFAEIDASGQGAAHGV